jgi:hypothetical protein
MANQLKMAAVEAIQALHRRGWSARRIARELGIHRETVARHVRLSLAAPGQNRPEVIPGSDGSKPANLPIGSEAYADGIALAEPGGGPDGGPAFIALRPTADEGSLADAAGQGKALLASNLSGPAGPYGTGGIHPGTACLIPQQQNRPK